MRTFAVIVAALLNLAVINACSQLMAEPKAQPVVVEGWIHSVDAKAGTFVLGGRNESQTKFRVAREIEGNREPAHVLLDGKKAPFETALQPKRKASVTYVKVGNDELWVWKVEVTSASK